MLTRATTRSSVADDAGEALAATRTGVGVRAETLLLAGVLCLLLGAIVQVAWLCDDAYITFRTVDNFAEGYGLRWNVEERVQTFTHPLWLFLLSATHAYTGEFYFSTLALSLLTTLAALALLALVVARSRMGAVAALSVLLLSKSFVEYSTSGLENPLSHLLLALFAALGTRRDATPRLLCGLALIAALAALNRMDTLLLYLPPLAVVWWRGPRLKGAALVLAGFLPFLLWELFSLFYYGFPFPNTAYAKLQTGIARADLIGQGLHYLWNSLRTDPLTLLAIAGTLGTVPFARGRLTAPLALGLAGYLAYVVWIGGDFMSGRFLSVVVFGAALLLAGREAPGAGSRALGFGLVALLGFGGLAAAHRASLARHPVMDRAGVADERAVYAPNLGLLHVVRGDVVEHAWAELGRDIRRADEPIVQLAGGVGLMGFHAGPVAHLLDVHGLGDPLLARLPVGADWRVGHYVREPRADYVDSLRADRNLIADPDLGRYYGKLRLITRGELLDPARLRAIVEMNLGRYDRWLDAYVERSGHKPARPLRFPI